LERLGFEKTRYENMLFSVFDSRTGDDVPTIPEQILGARWGESGPIQKAKHCVFVAVLLICGFWLFVGIGVM
jgi:hypothetical protein